MKKRTLNVNGFEISDDSDCFVIAEIGNNHQGDLQKAKEMFQAAILQAKFPHLDSWNEKRRELSKRYTAHLAPLGIVTPVEREWAKHVYHLYIIRSEKRDQLQAFLKQKGIASEVYYPIPPHLSVPSKKFGYKEGDFPHAEKAAKETLALPLYPELTLTQQDEVIAAVKEFAALM
jgi:dTDP-4-amino-4,6-dideoxygalactose transaminase